MVVTSKQIRLHAPLRNIRLWGQAEFRHQQKKAAEMAQSQRLATAPAKEVESLLVAIEAATKEFFDKQHQHRQELEKFSLELALLVAEQIVGKQVEAAELDVFPVVQAGIQQLAGADKLQVKLNPQDLNFLTLSHPQASRFEPHVELIADSTLNAGTCVVTSDEQMIASTMRQRLDAIRQLVKEEFRRDRS